MEHQTCTSTCDTCVDGNNSYAMLHAHELAHHWWGDHVTCATWDDIWLNEGFATFSEAAAVEGFQGWESYLFYVDQLTQTYISWIDYEGLFPLSEPDYMWGGTVYDKGGVTMHMLRMEMGDSDFFEGLVDYGTQYSYSSATTDDFQQAMQAHTAADLELFFGQWVHRAGHPVLGIDSRSTELDDGFQIDIAVEQTQVWPELWDVQLPILFEGEPTAELLHVDADKQLFSICRDEDPGDFEVDPDRHVLRRNGSADVDDYEFVDVCSPGDDDDSAGDDDDSTGDDDSFTDDDTTDDPADDDAHIVDGRDGCKCDSVAWRSGSTPFLPALFTAALAPLLGFIRRRRHQ